MLFILLTLEAGFLFQEQIHMPGQDAMYQTINEMHYTVMGAEAVAYDIFFVGATVNMHQRQNHMLSYTPVRTIYSASAGARWNGFEIGVYHDCMHMVDLSQDETGHLRGGETRAYIQYQGKLEVF